MRSSIDKTTKSVLSVLPDEGKEPIDRIIQAYGFRSRQALCDHLGVSKSTMANRVMRDSFPADWIIICALQTGVSLHWLTSGEGPMFEDGKSDAIALSRFVLEEGKMIKSGYLMFDKTMLPDDNKSLLSLVHNSYTYVLEQSIPDVATDGYWLIEIDDQISVRELIRLPGNKVRVTQEKVTFECGLDDIKLLAKVVSRTERFKV